MAVFVTNALSDCRWNEFARWHPQASVFHQRGWLDALARTYRYEPFVVTTASPGQPLLNGLVFCRVASWLTGARLVSVPFADHCQPLFDNPSDESTFSAWLTAECGEKRYKYVELRPLSAGHYKSDGLRCGDSYCFHELDLAPRLEQLFRNLHKSSIQRKVLRAEREHLSCESGHSEHLLGDFYRLLVLTRKRHQLPPQPQVWFKTLLECMGDDAQIRVARKDGEAIAAILTLQHKATIVYKYGCSDERFHNLGGMPFLFWKLIEDSKATGVETLDLGRSDLDNVGLITFKDRFGAKRQTITYYRCAGSPLRYDLRQFRVSMMRHIVPYLPSSVVRATGRLLYRHMG